MLSYRHLFHAGNHADVLKHCVLCAVLDYFNRKDSPYWYIDTHAGAGRYDLRTTQAMQNAEYQSGVMRLWGRQGLPPGLAILMAQVRGFNPRGELRFYPGSPLLAQAMLRDADRLHLFELHPADAAALHKLLSPSGRRARVRHEDGFAGLRSLLPPPPRRAVVLIDPPYEIKADYRTVQYTLDDALRRFAQGCYLVWYPLLGGRGRIVLGERLEAAGYPAWLRVELQVADSRSPGMHGSGLFVVNPPWTLAGTLDELLPTLCELLAVDSAATTRLTHRVP